MLDAPLASLWLPLLDQVTPYGRFWVALLTAACACLFLAGLAILHKRRLAHIPLRIHVSGTRGKSTTVRLVAAGLRAGGYRVVGKTTGTRPRLILPDGSERPIRRWGAPAIREQLDFFAAAARAKADAIVVEAMAIEPEYLHALERFYVRATDFVITNVRPDHLEQLGPDPDAMARAIAQALPPGGRVFLTTEAATPALRERAQALRCQLTIADDHQDADRENANLLLARAICRHYGVKDALANAAMDEVHQGAGAFSLKSLHINGRSVSFANAFSCNDVESFTRLWRRHRAPARPITFLFNARADRPLRSRAFFDLLTKLAPDAPLFVTQGTRATRHWAVKSGFATDRVHILPRSPARQCLERVVRDMADGSVIWGIGNFKGAGEEISAFVDAAAPRC